MFITAVSRQLVRLIFKLLFTANSSISPGGGQEYDGDFTNMQEGTDPTTETFASVTA
jgi:hypothetical protein